MKSYKKLGKNVLLLTLGSFSSKILTFLLVPFYTAILTTEEYGTADLLTTTVNLILPFFTVLIYEAVMRYALDQKDRNQVFSIGFYITILGSLLLVFCSPILLLIEDLKEYIWLFIFYYISLAFYNLILQFLKGIEKVTIYSIAGVLNTFIYIICNLLFLLAFNMRIEGYLLSAIIGHIVSALIAFFMAKLYRYLLPAHKLSKEYIKKMLKYSGPMIPNSASWWISSSSDKYILTFFSGFAVSGLYSVAYKVPTILTTVVSIFIGAWQISAVENFGSEESRKFYEEIYDKYESLLFLIASFLIAFTKIISFLLFSSDFFSAWSLTPILIYAFIFNSLSTFYGSVYTSAKKTKMFFYSTLVGAIVNIILNFVFIIPWGAIGAAIATAISYFVIWLIRLINSRKILQIRIHWGRDIAAHILLFLEIILICIDFNPYYIVSVASVLGMCIICSRFIKTTIQTIIKKVKDLKNKTRR